MLSASCSGVVEGDALALETAVTARTRPPAVTIAPSLAAVPAWKTTVSGVHLVEAVDGFAVDDLAGIASAGGDDADACAGLHANGEAVGGAVDGGVEEIDDVAFETDEDGLGLGVAEAGVELEDHGAD